MGEIIPFKRPGAETPQKPKRARISEIPEGLPEVFAAQAATRTIQIQVEAGKPAIPVDMPEDLD